MNDAIEAGGSAPPIHAEQKPRRMLQPIKDAIRLRAELGEAWAAYWRAKHDEVAEKLDDALEGTTVRKLLVVAVVIGFALGRFIP